MKKEEIIKRIIEKKEFSDLPEKDIKLAYEKFDREIYSDKEKIKKTRDFLRKVFSAFVSQKILSSKEKNEEWMLRKHLSTRERIGHYEELYGRIFGKTKNGTVFDLGAGINGFSYKYFPSRGSLKYIAIESIGQLVDRMNEYFLREGLDAKAIKESLFNIDKVKEIISSEGSEKNFIFLFKTLDSLEMVDRDYSKKLLKELSTLSNFFIVSFATKSMVKRKKFRVDRSWIIDFIADEFKITDDFELGTERYIVFENKK